MICSIVGARPNFIKMAPIIEEIRRRNLPQLFVHTGQHYDAKMSTIFFEQLQMPQPDIYLGVGSGSHAEQTAKVMLAFEQICLERKPALVIVAGDVNSTLACALAASKLNIPVAHVESGLRSFDRAMPEEINRILTDHICELLFTTEESGNNHLLEEGIAPDKIHFVGNTMIDTLRKHLATALSYEPWKTYGFEPNGYGVVTFHRPSNVDTYASASILAESLRQIGERLPLLFPIHPRTLSRFASLWNNLKNVRIVEPLGYLEFLGLMARAQVVITDSGGIQEETTALGTRCVTVRRNTERPVTVTEGTNRLVDPEIDQIVKAVFESESKEKRIPPLWDGCAEGRAVDVIQAWLKGSSR
jgi:UDP-N-acetylglucosamine 2-epimerase (non-hydrolysing)